MLEVLGLGFVVAIAGYRILHSARPRMPRGELIRLRRLSEEMRRTELHIFE